MSISCINNLGLLVFLAVKIKTGKIIQSLIGLGVEQNYLWAMTGKLTHFNNESN